MTEYNYARKQAIFDELENTTDAIDNVSTSLEQIASEVHKKDKHLAEEMLEKSEHLDIYVRTLRVIYEAFQHNR